MFQNRLNVGMLTMERKTWELLEMHVPKYIIFSDYRDLLNFAKIGVSCRRC